MPCDFVANAAAFYQVSLCTHIKIWVSSSNESRADSPGRHLRHALDQGHPLSAAFGLAAGKSFRDLGIETPGSSGARQLYAGFRDYVVFGTLVGPTTTRSPAEKLFSASGLCPSFVANLHPHTYASRKERTHLITSPDFTPEGGKVAMVTRKRIHRVASAHSRSPKSKRQRQHQAPAVETFPIPQRLQGFIDRVGDKGGLFALRFPIDHLDGIQRLAWGLAHRADFVIMNVEFLQGENKSSGHARFCVHFSTDRGKDPTSTAQPLAIRTGA